MGLSVVTGVGRALGLVGLGDGVGVPSVGDAGAGVGLSGVDDGLTLGLTVTTGSSSSPPQAVSTPRASAAVATAAPTRAVVVSSVRVGVVPMSGAYARSDEGRRPVEFDHLIARGEHPRVVRCHDDDGAVVGEFAKQFADHLGVRVIERRGGFVSEDDPGLVQDEAGESDSLLLTPTQPGHLRRVDPLQVNSSQGCGSSPSALP
ncbi:hypothetical protein ASG28_11745 [Frigoribacterium sp. Leaf415]|nr:hypothetical protein ASF07_11735 [Frigoribacterium sp. Leaf254]KQT40137.1 hypothetical protein ASG28_11745 [Frigoribacterium sp. Leaf415]